MADQIIFVVNVNDEHGMRKEEWDRSEIANAIDTFGGSIADSIKFIPGDINTEIVIEDQYMSITVYGDIAEANKTRLLGTDNG